MVRYLVNDDNSIKKINIDYSHQNLMLICNK